MSFASELKRDEVAQYWKNSETFATSLVTLAIDEWGTECLEWDPKTFRMELKDVYKIDIPQKNVDKLMAAIVIMTTNLFYTSVDTFHNVANALNGSLANFQVWDPLEASEAAWAITEANMIDMPDLKKDFAERFSPAIRKYLGIILEDEGIINSPDVLKIAIRTTSKEASQTFADEPAMYQSFYRLSQAKEKDIYRYVKDRAVALLRELHKLPLQNRDENSWKEFVERTSGK
jgi:hypothetical protein